MKKASASDCNLTKSCDSKYVLQTYFWRGIAISALAIVITAFWIGQWVFAIDSQTKANTMDIATFKVFNQDVDTLKLLLRRNIAINKGE